MGNERITLRDAVANDAPQILEFIRRKAAFDVSTSASDGAIRTTEEAIRETLFGPAPFAQVLLAERDGAAVGFACYYFRYSSFQGRPSLWLDDLFVIEAARNLGIGAALMRRLAQTAVTRRCSHMAWTASRHNPGGIRFYQRLGATITDQHGKSVFFQADGPILHRLAQEPCPHITRRK